MATHALSPAPLPANNDRATFNAALARYADATAARDALPCPSPIARELAAGDAVDFATEQLAAAPAPDLPAFAELRSKLERRKKLDQTDASVEKAKDGLVQCLRLNDRRPLDCWEQVEAFKAEVAKLEQKFVDRTLR